MKTKKLSQSKASANHFETKSKPISKEMEEKLKKAGDAANKNISRNNMIYQSSNSHSQEHSVVNNEEEDVKTRKKITESTVPKEFFSIELHPLDEETLERLHRAGEAANKTIERNNKIINSSNGHASGYPVGCNKVKKLGGR